MSVTHRLRSDEGFGLVEVLVTAMIVLILAAGLLAGLDASSHATGRAKARSVAMTLAQKDQERLRAMPITTLANVDETKPQKVCDSSNSNCVDYTVTSRAEWVSDSKGLESCTTATAGLDYLKVTSTVSWPGMGASEKPITTQSMVTPAIGALGEDKGSLAVQIVRADGITGVGNVTVNISGPASDSGKTNSLGCVVWGLLPTGNYTASVSQFGFVGVQGIQAISAPAGVVANSLSTTTILYDGAASANITFFSKVAGTRYDEEQSAVTLKQSQMSPVTRVFPTDDGNPGALITAKSLFPFKVGSPGGPYSIYPGGCPGAEPPAPVSLADLAPDQNIDYELQIPAFDFTVQENGAASGTAKTKIVPVTQNCDDPDPSTVQAQPVQASGPDKGRPQHPGFPYGTYDVCAENGAGTLHQTFTAVDLEPTDSNDLTVKVNGGAINLTSASDPGPC